MSRNLCRTTCYYCQQDLVLEEEPRPITEEEAGAYFSEYRCMPVAKAHCPDCLAKYLAWMGSSLKHHNDGWDYNPTRGVTGVTKSETGIHDLSFRRSFNDEPHEDDLPRYHIVRHLELDRVPYEDPKPEDTAKKRWTVITEYAPDKCTDPKGHIFEIGRNKCVFCERTR